MFLKAIQLYKFGLKQYEIQNGWTITYNINIGILAADGTSKTQIKLLAGAFRKLYGMLYAILVIWFLNISGNMPLE